MCYMPTRTINYCGQDLRGLVFSREAFIGCDFRGANLTEAIMANAYHHTCDFTGADMSKVKLEYSTFVHCDFIGAKLFSAKSYGGQFTDCDFTGAYMNDIDLAYSTIVGSNLASVDLSRANLSISTLLGCDLSRAKFTGANLEGARLDRVTSIPDELVEITNICPEGDIIGYKKLTDGVICTLRIPAAAKRSNAIGRKCRAEYAIVIDGEGTSIHDEAFEYKIGETVRPTTPFDGNRWEECASGIHFFLTEEEAIDY